MSEDIPVIVVTKHRTVYYGMADRASVAGRTIRLTEARMAIRWGTTGGVAQLAATGPTDLSRIGSMAKAVILQDVVEVLECTEAAAKEWAQC